MTRKWMLPALACVLALTLAACGGGNNGGGGDNAGGDSGSSDDGGGSGDNGPLQGGNSTGSSGSENGSSTGKILLRSEYVKGEVIIETTVETSDQNMHFGSIPMLKKEEKSSVSRMEVLGVDGNGYPTEARLSWTKVEITEQKNKRMSEEWGEPTKGKSGLTTAVIHYERDPGSTDFKATLDEGDDASGAVQKNLDKVDPFLVPFIPEREVSIGESWEVDRKALERFFGENDKLRVTEQKAACKAAEMVDEDGLNLLKVTFDMSMTGTLLDERLGEGTPFSARTTGYFLWDVDNQRAHRAEINPTMEFEGESQGNKITMKQSGKTTKTFEYEMP